MVFSLESGAGQPTEGSLDTVASLKQLGNKQHVNRGVEIYFEGSQSKHWYEVVSGTVRLVTFLASPTTSHRKFPSGRKMVRFRIRREEQV